MIRSILFLSMLTCLTACGPSSLGSQSSKRSVEVQGFKVTWADAVLKNNNLSKAHADLLATLGPKESVFFFSRYELDYSEPSFTLSNGARLTGVGACEFLRKSIDNPRNVHDRSYTEEIYSECLVKQAEYAKQDFPKPKELSFERFVGLAQVAVESEGSCTWIGYDRGIDLRLRVVGALASASDERLFFARLRCDWL